MIKSIYSVLIASLVPLILTILVKKPESAIDELYEIILEKNKNEIRKKRREIERNMIIRYFIYYILVTLTIIFSFYYCCIFCTIYVGSCETWVWGGLISILIGFVVNFFALMFFSISRILLIKYSKKK